jgi:hypothetical protein
MRDRLYRVLDSLTLTRLLGLTAHYAYWRLLKEQGDGTPFSAKVPCDCTPLTFSPFECMWSASLLMTLYVPIRCPSLVTNLTVVACLQDHFRIHGGVLQTWSALEMELHPFRSHRSVALAVVLLCMRLGIEVWGEASVSYNCVVFRLFFRINCSGCL